MKKERIAIILSLTVLFVCSGLTNAAAGSMINNIRFESPSSDADRIIFELNGPSKTLGKALPGENPRLYFDFTDTAPASNVKNRIPVDGNYIKQIRHAYHKGPKAKTRVVFDLISNQKVKFNEDFDKDTNTLVITLFLEGTEPGPVAITPSSSPKPAVTKEPVKTEPAVTKAPVKLEPVVKKEATKPEAPAGGTGKKIQPMNDVSIAVANKPEKITPDPKPLVPPKAQEFIPTQTKPVAKPKPSPIPAPKPIVQQKVKPVVQPKPDPIPSPKPVAQAKPDPVPAPKPIVQQKAKPVVQPKPDPIPTPKSVTPPKPQKEEVKPLVASIPPTAKMQDPLESPIDEATVIQPMSEVGIQDKEGVEDRAPVLHSIEFDPQSNRGETISFKLNGFYPPVVFGIEEDIPRIVCFFKNASAANELKDMLESNGRFVKFIKIGKYKNPDNIRVVLELVPGYNYDLQQIFFKDDKVFMIIINRAGKQITSQEQ